MALFDPPGYLKDFTPENKKKWSDAVSSIITGGSRRPNVSQFYNPLTEHTNETPQLAPIPWTAFPQTIRTSVPNDIQRWQRADRSRDVQDEYCEWSVQRNAGQKITRIVFTCEVPEYWQELAAWQPDTVLELYREHNPGYDIKQEDLFDANGNYFRKNKWNNSTTGSIMHLIQRNNNLAAAVFLAADATVHRIDHNSQPVTAMDALIRCSQFGAPSRNSDPFIGHQVNLLARGGALITTANPPGLYIHSFDASAFHTPDGTDPNEFWKFTRGMQKGDQTFYVRGVFEVPPEKNYVVGDIEDEDGNKIQWGGQLADHIQVRITGQAIRSGLHTASAYPCLDVSEAGSAQPFMAKHAPFDPDVNDEEEDDRAGGLKDPGFACY